MVSKTILSIGAIAWMGALLCGCNAGNAPTGASEEQLKAEFAKEDPQKQIQGIQYSPMPPAEKEKRIQEIEKKYNVHRGVATPSAPSGAGPAPTTTGE